MIINKFKNKKVLITGHTGFKGSWLTLFLKLAGAKIMGISLKPITKPSFFKAINLSKGIRNNYLNILNRKKLENKIISFKPDFIFHLAAQPLITEAYTKSFLTWETNLIGTINILEIIKKLKKSCTCVLITSDKCYENIEKRSGYRETDRIGGSDPYSASKAAAEIAIKSYFQSFLIKSNHRIATARAGNVVGGGDWNYGRIIPDCMFALNKKRSVIIRNPNSSRPWQHVVEIVYGYLKLAILLKENIKLNGQSFNFGPSGKKIHKVNNILQEIKREWKDFEWSGDKKQKTMNETNLLVLNCDKSKKILNWGLKMTFKKTIKLTIDWYKAFYEKGKKKKNIRSLTEKQILDYCKLVK